jgi:hypothetical protein
MASLLHRLFGLDKYDTTTRSDAPRVSNLPEPAAVPATRTLRPVENWCHPFKNTGDPLRQLTQLAKAASGYYPLGRSGLWHGGVHFDSGTAGTLKQSTVHCLADGEVVAYRIDTDSPTTAYFDKDRTVEKPFSRNFVLVRHHLQPPKIQGSQDIPPSLTFYSLYMHLQDWAKYRQDSTLARPTFWPERATFRVKQTAKDARPGQPEQLGLNVYNKQHGKVIDFLPRGAEVAISGTGEFRRLEGSLGPAKLLNPDGSIQGYVATRVLLHPEAKETRVNSSKGIIKVNVRAEPVISDSDNVIFELPVDSQVTVSGAGEFRKLERIVQYVQFDSLEGAIEPVATDQIVVLDQPVAIMAGDLIGHLGQYQRGSAELPQEQLHLETFSGDDVEAFIDASREWVKRLPEKDKTWLKLPVGTPVVPSEGNHTAGLLQASSESSPRSAADLLVPKKLLDGLPADQKIQVPATSTRKARTWYHLKHLLHDADNNLLDGWVCEDPGVTSWVSPWAWDGYGVIVDYSRPKHMLASFLSAIGRLSEEERERYRVIAEKDDKGPMKKRLYEIIGRKPDGTLTASELLEALERPAHAQAISQMVLYKESEWFQQPQIWDALDELLGHSGSTPHLNWLAEKQRIAQMGWWREVSEKVGLPSWGSAYHLHPVGLVGLFKKRRAELWVLGTTSEHYESGGRGPGVISTGRGDHGGVSYGIYQMSSRKGVVQEFIEQSAYAIRFSGLDAGTDEFNNIWRDIATNYPEEFRSAQHDYIKKTHYDVQIRSVLSRCGFPIHNKNAALNDLVWSTSVQFGPRSRLIEKAIKSVDISSASIIEIIGAVQDYKISKNSSLFASSPSLQSGLLARAKDEKRKLLELEMADYEVE